VTETSETRKQQRQAAAELRDKLRPLKKALTTTEQHIDAQTQKLHDIQTQLLNNDLYQEANKATLANLLKQEGLVKSELEALEAQWLTQQEALEELEAEFAS